MKMKFLNTMKYLVAIFIISAAIFMFFVKLRKLAEKPTLSGSIPLSALQRLWTSKEHINMLDLISTVMDAMETEGVPMFINYGTLLGSFRHHDITPWDDDADVGAPISAKTRISSVLQKLSIKQYRSEWTESTQIRVSGPYSKLYNKGWPWRWPYIDIDLYSEDTNYIWFYNSGNVYKHPKAKIFPLHKRPLGNILVNSPHDGIDCLKRMFSDLANCTSGSVHRLGYVIKPKYSIPCSELSLFYPFVYRDVNVKGELLEILQLGDYNISSIVSLEPSYTANITFFNMTIK